MVHILELLGRRQAGSGVRARLFRLRTGCATGELRREGAGVWLGFGWVYLTLLLASEQKPLAPGYQRSSRTRVQRLQESQTKMKPRLSHTMDVALARLRLQCSYAMHAVPHEYAAYIAACSM